ncbi:DUF6635 family protein [Acidisphaera sp. S103]|uniref:DUF6635 family protein n=1 Tax=Acidisphaera sp. S103 TaxID=1747223 RepID=UPI00131D37FB|nr:DUF6635 family protein [Acidisphaera sp. S103]
MTHETGLVPVASEADQALARQIVDDGVRRYFAACRERIRPFVDRNFSLRGSISLHRTAVGWDIARAPLNLTMAAPQVGLLLAARAANRLGAKRSAARLRGKQLVVHTAVGKELAWRLHTDLLQLPYTSDGRVAAKDALAETILADPRVMTALAPALRAVGTRGDDPALRRHLDAAMTEYARTRGASTEITTAIISLTAGALALRRLTPGALSFSPALASAVAKRATAMSLPMAFPLGGALGSLWYTLFPVAPAAVLVMGLTGGLLAATTAASAFAGVIADPVQRRLGLHERRLRRLVDALERQMLDPAAPAFTVHDHYVARVLDVFDVAGALAQIAAF